MPGIGAEGVCCEGHIRRSRRFGAHSGSVGQGMSVSEETQVEPGIAKRGDLGVLRLRLRSRGKMTRTAASIPGRPSLETADEWMCPIWGARKTDFRGLEPGEEVPGGFRRIKGN